MTQATQPNKFGRRVVFARGMSCDVESQYVEWIDEMQRRLGAHDELVAALRFIQTRSADNHAFQKVISAALAKVQS